MARIIDFYFPARYSPKPKQTPERGKLLQFPASANKQSA